MTSLFFALALLWPTGAPNEEWERAVALYESTMSPVTTLRSHVIEHPEDVWHRYHYAVALGEARQSQTALAQFEQVTRRVPNEAFVYARAASYADLSGQSERAIALCDDAIRCEKNAENKVAHLAQRNRIIDRIEEGEERQSFLRNIVLALTAVMLVLVLVASRRN